VTVGLWGMCTSASDTKARAMLIARNVKHEGVDWQSQPK